MPIRTLFTSVVVAVLAVTGAAGCSEPTAPFDGAAEADAALTVEGLPAVYTIEVLSPLGGIAGRGRGLTNQGWVAGSVTLVTLPDTTQHAAAWRNNAALDLGALGGPLANSSVPWPGVNERGVVVGISETATPDTLGEAWSCAAFLPSLHGHTCVGFVWEDGVMRALPTFGGPNGFATGINNRDLAVGWAENTVFDPTCTETQRLQFRAVVWEVESGRMRELPPLPGDSTSAATAVNDRGQAVGISGRCDVAVGRFSAQHAVLWERVAGTVAVTDIGNLGGTAWHTPMAISERGEVVGFSNPPDGGSGEFLARAFRWTPQDGIEDLGTLPGDSTSQALGVNERGLIVGLSSGLTLRAVLWERGSLRDLNLLVPAAYAGSLLIAGHINERGQITGTLLDPATQQLRAFLATPRLRP